MNQKRAFFAFIIAFVFIFMFGFVWHGILMKHAYLETAALWRAEADFNEHFWILILGHAVAAFIFTGIYICKTSEPTPKCGFRYGIAFGIFCCGIVLMRYAVEPLTTKILWMWLAGDLISFAIMGAIVGAIYKPRETILS